MNLGFGLVFGSDTSRAEAGIDRIVSGLESLRSQAASIGGEMHEIFDKSFGSLFHLGKELIGVSGEVEHATAELNFAYRDADQASLDNVKDQLSDASLYSMQTQKQLTEMVGAMKQVNNVDIFSPSVQAAVDKTNLKIKNSALLLSEVGLAAQDSGDPTRGIFNLLEGHYKRAAFMIRPLAAHIQDYQKAMAGLTDNTAKWAAIVPLLQRDFGGLTNYLMDTWPYLTNQIEDVKQKLFSTFGMPLMNELKGPLHEFLDYFTAPGTGLLTHENIHKLDGIRDAFRDIGHAVARAAEWVGHIARGIFEFVIAHPNIIKIVVATVAFVGALAGVAAGLIAVKLAVMALTFAFGGLFSVMLPVLAVVGIFAAAAYFIAKAAVHGKSFSDTMARLGEVLSAVWEGLSNMDGGMTTLSQHTADALKEKGLLGFAVRLMEWGYRIKRFFEGIGAGFSDAFGEGGVAYNALKFLADRISAMFGTIGDITGASADTASDKWHSAGYKIAKVISYIVAGFAYGFGALVTAIDYLIQAFGVLLDVLEEIKGDMQWIWDKASDVVHAPSDLAMGAMDKLSGVSSNQDTRTPEEYRADQYGAASNAMMFGDLYGGQGAAADALAELQRRHHINPIGMSRDQIMAQLNPQEQQEYGILNSAVGSRSRSDFANKGGDYNALVSAIKDAMSTMTIAMDGTKVGQVVDANNQQTAERGGRVGNVR